MINLAKPVQLVWFKRDLRVVDHLPLVEAAAHGRQARPAFRLSMPVCARWLHMAGSISVCARC
jgi:deoxyribodipyrimidine photolyase